MILILLPPLPSHQIMLRFLAVMIVAGAANVYVFIPVAVVIVLLLLLRWYYLTTAREVKRLEAIGVLMYSVAVLQELYRT